MVCECMSCECVLVYISCEYTVHMYVCKCMHIHECVSMSECVSVHMCVFGYSGIPQAGTGWSSGQCLGCDFCTDRSIPTVRGPERR